MPNPVPPLQPPTEPMLATTPDLRARICGMMARITASWPKTLVSKTAFTSSSLGGGGLVGLLGCGGKNKRESGKWKREQGNGKGERGSLEFLNGAHDTICCVVDYNVNPAVGLNCLVYYLLDLCVSCCDVQSNGGCACGLEPL